MFIIDRSRDGPENTETFQIAGTTGNIYTVTIDKLPSCTCPDNRRARNQCKHIIYVLVRVLKAPPNLQYQAAFLSTELEEIFAGAPAPPGAKPDSGEEEAGHRKPIEGDCPICVLEFEPEKEEIIWCRLGCGNNIHAECFKRWATSRAGQPVTCVYCRADWQSDDDAIKKLSTAGPTNEEGYVNVASELGLSGRRGMSCVSATTDGPGRMVQATNSS